MFHNDVVEEVRFFVGRIFPVSGISQETLLDLKRLGFILEDYCVENSSKKFIYVKHMPNNWYTWTSFGGGVKTKSYHDSKGRLRVVFNITSESCNVDIFPGGAMSKIFYRLKSLLNR